MKQVFLSGQGQVDVIEAPVPGRLSGGILVRNAFSLISAGTEGAAVTRSEGVKGLYEKVMNSRDRAGQVWSMVQSQGLGNTMSLIQNKLADHTPIGYSSAGVVLEVDSEDLGFKPGQRVACMGAGYANHAEYVVVPKNLAVALPDSVDFDHAAFAAIACIAMQGIRRLELSPGELVAVVGLGLIGQIALRLATAMGYRTCGFDIDEQRVEHARQFSAASSVMNSSSLDTVAHVMELTDGVGVDGVVICASSKGDAIINQAFEMCRRRGRVSVVGDIGLGLQRAKMYAKELEVRLSCSYGAGRYDSEYESEGRDYPLAYARWTERRNLDFFINLLAEGRLDLSDLVSAKVEINDAKQAYAHIKSGYGGIYGVLLDYALPPQPKLPEQAYKVLCEAQAAGKNDIKFGVIGVGAYAKNIHLPNLLKIDNVSIRAVASRSGGSAAVAARKVKAAYATSDVVDVFSDNDIDAVVISTRHSSHARLVLEALRAGKHVFVEKPMATTTADCLRIVEAQRSAQRVLRVGYNRRFAPYLQEMKRGVGVGKKLFNVRVNVGAIAQHWSNTADEGGRLLGEGVHFFDLATWMVDSQPIAVSAQFIGEPDELNPDASVSIRYENGSVANISYVTLGNTERGKEYFELFGNGRSVVIDDYKSIQAYGCKASSVRSGRDNKGQKEAMAEFVDAVRIGENRKGADALAGLWATAITEAALESAKTSSIVSLAQFIERRGFESSAHVYSVPSTEEKAG